MRPKWPWLAAGGGALALGFVLAISGLASGRFAIATPFIHLGILGAAALTYGLRSIKGARFREGTLRVDGQRITLDGREIALASEIEQGFVVPSAVGTLIRLEPRGVRLPIWLRVADVEAGGAVLRAIGLDAGHAAAEMRIASGLLAMSLARQLFLLLVPVPLVGVALVSLAVLLGTAAGPLAFALPLLLVTYVFVLAFAPTTVRVGTDGVVVGWLSRERFVPYSDVGKVESYAKHVGGKLQQGVALHLASGAIVRLPTDQTDIGQSDAARLARRIEEARLARHAGAHSHASGALARRGRAPRDWITALRRIGAGATAGTRTAGVPLDALVEVVEDATATAVDRASAAAALLPYADDDAKQRIRIAAETTASPKLRIALDGLQRGAMNDEAIASALIELEQEEASPPAPRQRKR